MSDGYGAAFFSAKNKSGILAERNGGQLAKQFGFCQKPQTRNRQKPLRRRKRNAAETRKQETKIQAERKLVKIMSVTRAWKVYGEEGHRQRESFFKSSFIDCTTDGNVRIIEVENSDKTGTNDYSIIRITRNTAEECESELDGQISDGAFENSRVGEVVEV